MQYDTTKCQQLFSYGELLQRLDSSARPLCEFHISHEQDRDDDDDDINKKASDSFPFF
jgi:hypothetical protein